MCATIKCWEERRVVVGMIKKHPRLLLVIESSFHAKLADRSSRVAVVGFKRVSVVRDSAAYGELTD